jgi:hypothetical protein
MLKGLHAICAIGLLATAAQSQEIQFRETDGSTRPARLLGISTKGLDEQIRQALVSKTGFTNLRSFSIHWSPDAFRCMIVTNELYPESETGVCLVKASAFQVSATALIVKRQHELEVSILDALIE